jgi:hypothetical protein
MFSQSLLITTTLLVALLTSSLSVLGAPIRILNPSSSELELGARARLSPGHLTSICSGPEQCRSNPNYYKIGGQEQPTSDSSSMMGEEQPTADVSSEAGSEQKYTMDSLSESGAEMVEVRHFRKLKAGRQSSIHQMASDMKFPLQTTSACRIE